MALPKFKFYTEEESKMKQAFENRILNLYREKDRIDKEKLDIDKRIEHLENQISKLGIFKFIGESESYIKK